MTAVQQAYKTSPDQSKRSECSRRGVPKIKMGVRSNLIWLTVLVSRPELVVGEE